MGREAYSIPCPPPGGKYYTHSVKKYIEAWHALGEPVARLLNARIHGFDPGISFLSNVDDSYIHLTTKAVKDMAERLGTDTERKRLTKALEACQK